MPLSYQQLRERLGAAPGAIGIDPEDGTLVYASQQVGGHYVPGQVNRSLYANAPGRAPGARHASRILYRHQLGLPHA
jgi:hypothetical protein